jgi:hypothetical protein
MTIRLDEKYLAFLNPYICEPRLPPQLYANIPEHNDYHYKPKQHRQMKAATEFREQMYINFCFE